jgi:hypothetical protein
MSREQIGIHGILRLYRIEPEWAENPELFNALWLPKVARGPDGLYRIVEDARISDEAKAGRLVMEPVENLLTNTGIALILTNLSVANQSQQFPVTQILSVGNGAIGGVTRSDTSVNGDGFTNGARKAPSSYQQVGFQTTIITNFGNSDAVGTWTNVGFYGYSVAGSQNATTTAGTGALMTHALFPWSKANGAPYAVSYVFTLAN